MEIVYSVIAPEGHSSTQAPQSTHFVASITAISPTVIASCGHTSAHAPHAVHSLAFTVGIIVLLRVTEISPYKRHIGSIFTQNTVTLSSFYPDRAITPS
jgi:hypothetical protein